jgi:hypothetical protein
MEDNIMYFEPAKKTYYRFPSSNNKNNLDSRFYFPEKQHSSGEDSRFESKAIQSTSQHVQTF